MVSRGVVAAGSAATANAGAQILRQGGNAVDAAVGAVFASFTAEACISALGGGGFATVYDPASDQVRVFDFFCTRPGLNLTPVPDPVDYVGQPVPFGGTEDTYYVGRGSSAVPGNPAGMAALMAAYGTLSLAEVLAPAIRMAREGVALSPRQSDVLASLRYVVRASAGSAALFAPEGQVLSAGETFRNPAFAETLEHLSRAGIRDCYEGEIAAILLDDQRTHGGLITADDLADYEVIERRALHLAYRGHTLYTNPPPSAGGVLIAYVLKHLAQVDLGAMAHNGYDHLQHLVEAQQLATAIRYRERPEGMADAQPWLDDPARLADRLTAHDNRSDAGDTPPHTTHISVIDADGLTVSITTTPGGTAGYTVGDTGILMNNMLGEKHLNPDGPHGGPVGVRVTSMTAPTIIQSPDGAIIALGSAGSDRLRSAIVQMICNLIDFGMSPADAVAKARVHHGGEWLDLEKGYDPAVAAAFEAAGYPVRRWKVRNLYFGGANVAIRDAEGRFGGAGDPRRDGHCEIL
jgi:gamma-glutamyltranspeptidase / glutathione hydrolase